MNSDFDQQIFQKVVGVRRELHQHPELSGQEKQTAKTICRYLDQMGVSYTPHVAGTGVVAELSGPTDVPFVILRADMDALPIQEETDLPFTSVNNGVMHACGHDGHTAMVLGALELLSKEPSLPAPVRALFQPAEESGKGAPDMIKEGVLEGAEFIFGGHLDRHYQAGTIVVSEGPVNAAADTFSIEISGQGAHGARPHESIDAVVVGSLMIMALQTIVSREVDPARPSVVSVGLFHAGTAPNVIAGGAKLEGTIRAQHQDVREHLHGAVKRIAESIAQLHGAKISVSITSGPPPVINTAEMTTIARQAAELTVGRKNVVPLRTANMGGEDFSCYLEHISGAYVRIGGQLKGRESFPAHSSKFDFDEQALGIGMSYFHQLAKLAGANLRKRHTT